MTSTTPEATPPKVVYTTETGEEPRGGASLTVEATTPLPAPVKRIRKTTTKKHAPRVKAGSVTEPSVIRVDPRVMRAVKKVQAEGRYTKVQIVDAETVIVR